MSISLQNVYASIPQTTRGRPFFLSGDPKGENFLYTCGTSVVIRNIANPLIADLYDEHQRPPTACAYAPSGFYIASGDATGTVRIWDTTQKTHPLKIELRVLGSEVRDICWTADSQRIAVCGDGREKYAHAFFWDTGASVGDLSGHAKPVNSITIKPNRPFRLVTASEDFAMNWYEGPPFKYKKNFAGAEYHQRFVNCVRFAPDGSNFVSCGSDKKMFLFDGKTGDKKLEFEQSHAGGIYCVSWCGDNRRVLTASADRSCKIWDVETGKAVTTFQFAKTTENQQLGCLWQGDYLLSVSLDGKISYLDESNPDRPSRTLLGHNKFVTALACDRETGHLYSGSYDANVTRWEVASGETTALSGKGHTNQISQATVVEGQLVTGAFDDSLRVTPLASGEYQGAIGVDSPVKGVASGPGGVVVGATLRKIHVVRGGQVVKSVDAAWTPASVAISPDGAEVAVGGEDNEIHLFELSGNNLTEKGKLSGHRDNVQALQYSPCGSFLASGGKDRDVAVWDVKTGERKINGWIYHSSGVNDVAWSPDGTQIASASLDQDIRVWSLNKPTKKLHFKGAHRGGTNALVWIDNDTLASCGQDCAVKTWKIEPAQ